VSAPGFDKTEPRVERDVLDHLLVRIKPQLGIAEPARFVFGKRDQ